MTYSNAADLARLSLHNPDDLTVQHAQTLHRLALIQHFQIVPGSKVLELGCGQGDCTTVLADAVGEAGSVVAVDPAPLTYGAPYTLGQAQAHIEDGPLGDRIGFVAAAPLDYLSALPPPVTSSPSKLFDAAVLAHSLWYFSTPALLLQTLRALRRHATHLHLAEWSLSASHPSAQPHVLAALAQAALECRKPESESNVRTVLSPKAIKELAGKAGWRLEREAMVECAEGVGDGWWEVEAVLSEGFGKEIEEKVVDEREKGVVMALRDACEASLKGVEGGKRGVRAMDAWVGSFV